MTPQIDPPRASSWPTLFAALVVIGAAITTAIFSARWADAAVHLPPAREVAGEWHSGLPEHRIVGRRPTGPAGCLDRDGVLEPCPRDGDAVDPAE